MLHQMIWPPQSSDLNPVEMVWDKLDRRVMEKQPTSAQHMWELLGKAFLMMLFQTMPRVCKAVIEAKGGYFEESKIYFDLFNTFLVTT